MFLSPGQLSADKKGSVWYGSDDKLISFDGFHYTSYPLPAGLTAYTDHSQLAFLYEDKLGTSWAFLQNNGIYLFDKKSKQFSPFPFSENVLRHINKEKLVGKFLLEDSRNRLWISLSRYGLLCIDEKTKLQAYYHIKDNTQYSEYISASWLNDGVEMKDGSVYFGSNQGLVTIDSAGQAQIYKDHNPSSRADLRCIVNGIARSANPDELVMSTWGNAIKTFNTKTKLFTTFLMHPDDQSGYMNVINDLIQLTDSTYFFIKRDTLAKAGFGIFNNRSKKYHFFNRLEPSYVTREYYNIIQDGNFIWVANINQLYRFCIPALLENKPISLNTLIPATVNQPLQLAINKLWINDTERDVPEQGLALQNHENSLRLFFSCLGATMYDSLLFSYRLKGYETAWHTGYGTNIQYNNLSNGSYTLQIKADKSPYANTPAMLEMPITIAERWWQSLWLKVLAAAIVAILIASLYRWRIGVIKEKASLKNAYEKKIAEVEMKALRAQMNPHFIFNCLNSINRYIVKNDHVQASNYLTRFSKLIRKILDNSASGIISLETEIETLDLYLQMEAMRFHHKFTYSITADDEIDTHTVLIPSMLVQPYAENAIWHGLLHKNSDDCTLEIRFTTIGRQSLQITIEDNGVGRKAAAGIKSEESLINKSKGLQITGDRLDLIKNLYGISATAEIIDLTTPDGTAVGTKVMISLPLLQGKTPI